MQYEDDANDLGEHHNDMIGFTRERHAQEDAEDIEWQQGNDSLLNGF